MQHALAREALLFPIQRVCLWQHAIRKDWDMSHLEKLKGNGTFSNFTSVRLKCEPQRRLRIETLNLPIFSAASAALSARKSELDDEIADWEYEEAD
ncbi:hypothetical protein AJ87_05940 [Rhizobium yanglingense]|nr:hypothetical protein AJ87_05940 [Rhizobium yanglingense]